MNRRILIVRKYKGFGGIEHQIKMLAQEMLKNGWYVVLLTDRKSPFQDALMQIGVKTITKPLSSIIGTGQLIADICKREKIEIIQSHMFKEDISCRIAKLLRPKLKHVYRIHTYIDCSRIPAYKKSVYHLLARSTDFLVNYYAPINIINADELKKRSHIRADKIIVVHDAVRDFNTVDKPGFRNSHEISMIANFEEGKGHKIAIEGLKILYDRGECYKLNFIGGVPGRGTDQEDDTIQKEIIQMTSKYNLTDLVCFKGYCNDIPKELVNTDIVLLSSESEGTPNCLLEGMKLYKIVVSSKVGGVPEFIIDNYTGYTYEPNDGKNLADTISKVYGKGLDEIELVQKQAYSLVSNEYSITNMYNNMIKLYTRMFGLQHNKG